MNRLSSIVDEPISDPSIIPTYFLCNHASKFVKVALSGDAGDELFGGYPKYYFHPIADFLSLLPECLIINLSRLAKRLSGNSTKQKMHKFFSCIKDKYEIRNQSWVAPFSVDEINTLTVNASYKTLMDPIEFWSKKYIGSRYNKALYLDVRLMMGNMFLQKMGRASTIN